MTQKAQALVLAEPDASFRAALEGACQDAGYELVLEASAEVATSKLSARRFDALILDMTTPGAAMVSLKARGKLVRTRIPVVALVEEEDEVSFARAYRAGADEVLVASRPAALTARLRSLPKSGIPQPGASRGDAVVADADRARAEVLERVLRDAGFRVELAVDGFAARLQVGRPALKVAVLDASLDEAPALIMQARTRGARCAWIVRERPDGIEALRTALAKLDRVAVVNAYGPPDDVLFEANRLLEPRESDGRADKRQLYGTIVRLKWDGQRDIDIGYSYNVSSVGLFIRTLAAPSGSTVELELLPPGMETLVKLQAEVIWRREFGATRREPVPAGFGVKVIGGDVDVWSKACPRALSLPPQSIRPALIQVQSEPPPSALSTVRPDSPPLDNGAPSPTAPTLAPMGAGSAPQKVPPGPKRSSSTDKLRLPERLRTPIGAAFTAISKPRKEPSPVPPPVTAKEEPRSPTPPKVVGGREPQSSVEEMLLSVLSGSSPGEDVLGAAPLSIDGGEVVELEKEGAARPPSEEPPPPSVDSAPPPSAPRIEVRAPSKPAEPARAEPRGADSEAPVIEVHRGLASAAPARAERPSDSPSIEVVNRTDPPRAVPAPQPPPPPSRPQASPPPSRPKAAPAPEPPPPPARPSDHAELLDVEPLPSDPPKPPDEPAPPVSLEVESKDLVPDELKMLAAAAKLQEGRERNPDGSPKASDPLAATVRAATSPFPPEALQEGERPLPRWEMQEQPPSPPEPTVPQVRPSASHVEPEPDIELPTNGSNRLPWLLVIGIGAGALAFFAVPFIRNAVSPPAPEASATRAATALPAPMAPVPRVTARAVEPSAPSASAGSEAPSAAAPADTAAPAASAPAAPASAEVPSAAAAPSPPPSSGEEPDDAALATLEKGTGFLFVASPLQTNVYLYGILAGQTNQRIVSKCGPRFIRLGTAPGAWQTQGSVSIVKCGGFTRVHMNP
jgi:DNA-binding response OmpR family regulator